MTMLDAALSYAARGWPVFPCAPGSKVPAIGGGHGVLEATTDPDKIRAWWQAMPDANVAIATGAPGPDVVDVDVKDVSGYTALAELHAAGLAGDASALVRTPSGGLHAYYAGSAQRNGRIAGRGLDFRGAGGYVLAPPSAVGGKPYEPGPEPLRDTGAGVDWRACRALLDPPPQPADITAGIRVSAPDGRLRPGDDWAACHGWPMILAPHGWRLARDLGNGTQLWTRPGKDRGTSATTRADGGLYVFSSSTEFEPEKPYSKFGALAVLEHGGDHAAAASALRAAGYGEPLPAPAVTPAQPPQAADGQQDDGQDNWWTEIASRHQLIDWQQLWDDTPQDEQWLVEPLIGEGRLIAVYSAPKAGKSLLALEIAAAVATGRPVLAQPAGEPHRVLYVDLENSRRDLRDRLDALGYKPADLGNLAYLSFPSLPALNSAAGGRELVALTIEHGAVLVIIDTVSRVISGRENDADTFNELYYYALAPLKGRNVAVMRLDHAGKDMSKGQRGSSSKDGDVDQVWSLTAAGPVVTLRCERSRTLNEVQSMSLRRQADPLRHELRGGQDAVADRIAPVLAKLDDLGVPPGTGRPKAKAALADAGFEVDTNTLAEALRVRNAPEKLSDSDSLIQHDQQTAPSCLQDHQTGSDEAEVSAGQICLQDHQTGPDRSSSGGSGEPVWSGGHPSRGAPQTGAAAQSGHCGICGQSNGHEADCPGAVAAS